MKNGVAMDKEYTRIWNECLYGGKANVFNRIKRFVNRWLLPVFFIVLFLVMLIKFVLAVVMRCCFVIQGKLLIMLIVISVVAAIYGNEKQRKNPFRHPSEHPEEVKRATRSLMCKKDIRPEELETVLNDIKWHYQERCNTYRSIADKIFGLFISGMFVAIVNNLINAQFEMNYEIAIYYANLSFVVLIVAGIAFIILGIRGVVGPTSLLATKELIRVLSYYIKLENRTSKKGLTGVSYCQMCQKSINRMNACQAYRLRRRK